MLFWAGLRGAVGVALAEGLGGKNAPALRATVLVVVVLTVIMFGGTTARMLEILGIRTGVVEEIDSDDEFDIETTNGGSYYKRGGMGLGHTPKPSIGLDYLETRSMNGTAKRNRSTRGYSSSNRHSPPINPTPGSQRKNPSKSHREEQQAQRNLLSQDSNSPSDDDDLFSESDLPPAAPRRKTPSPLPPIDGPQPESAGNIGYAPPSAAHDNGGGSDLGEAHHTTLRDMLTRGTGDLAPWFKQLDDDFIKPTLLLDQGKNGP